MYLVLTEPGCKLFVEGTHFEIALQKVLFNLVKLEGEQTYSCFFGNTDGAGVYVHKDVIVVLF
jgi:hypothetical protein